MIKKRRKVNYYSQNGEDYLMWNLFDYKDNGFYMEVGAFDGRHFSNTYSFEKYGWRGICIEPHPRFFPLCNENRPNSICLNVACVRDNDVREVIFNAEEIGLLSGISVDEVDVKNRYYRRKLNFLGFQKIKVKTQTLTNILDNYAPNQVIDFISVDVEGTELDVIEGLDLSKYSPKAIIIEVNDEIKHKNINQYLENGNKYKFARKIGANAIYVLLETDIKKILSINLNKCILSDTKHPLGEEYTIKPHHKFRSYIISIFRNIFSRMK